MNTLQRIKQAIVDDDQSAAEQALLDHVKPYVDCLKATYLFERNDEVKKRIEKLITPELREDRELTAEDLVVGGKYVPVKKSTWNSLDDSQVWKDAKVNCQPYLYYTGVDEDGEHMFDLRPHTNSGDYFLPSDVKPYYEN